MSPPKWTAEHGNLLKSLREKAGLDIATLSRKNMVSPLQVGQLEAGGESAFYSADIKFSTGKKLLHALGHDLPEAVLAENRPPIETSSKLLASRQASRKPFQLDPKNITLPLLALLVAMGLLGWYVDSHQSMKAPEKVLIEHSAPTKLTTSDQPVVAVAQTDLDQSSTAPLPKEPAQFSTTSTKCNWQASGTEIQPSSPTKPANYVHLVAQQDVVVCVKDSEQREATLELQAGDARSIYGPEPFKVYSAQLAVVQIYFQGQLVKLASEHTQQIQLTAASR